MKCVILLLPVLMLVTITECDRSKDANSAVKTKEDKLDTTQSDGDAIDRFNLETKKSSTNKRQLNGRFFHVPKGNAYSYTHVVQTHGPVKKVVHAPEPGATYSGDHLQDHHPTYAHDEDGYNHLSAADPIEDDYGYFGPTKEPYFGPIYVTAKPVLPAKQDDLTGRAVSAANVPLQTHEGLVPFNYPLFRPYHGDVIDKQYTVPLQVVYRVPYQRNFAYQHLQQPYAIDYNQLSPYPIERPFAYTIQRPQVNHIATPGSLPYSYFLNNNYLGAYTAPEINTQEEDGTSSSYNSDESNR